MRPSVPYLGGIAAAQSFAQNALVCDSQRELEEVLEKTTLQFCCVNPEKTVPQQCASAIQRPDHLPQLERELETTVVTPVEHLHSRFEVGPSSYAWFTNLFTTRHNEKV